MWYNNLSFVYFTPSINLVMGTTYEPLHCRGSSLTSSHVELHNPLSSCSLSGSATLDGLTAVKLNIEDFRDSDPFHWYVRRQVAEVSKNLNTFIFRDEQFKDMWIY